PHDVLAANARGGARLAEKAGHHAIVPGQLRRQDLDRDTLAELAVLRLEDDPDAATTELAAELVLSRDDLPEPRRRERCLWPGGRRIFRGDERPKQGEGLESVACATPAMRSRAGRDDPPHQTKCGWLDHRPRSHRRENGGLRRAGLSRGPSGGNVPR